MFEEGAEGSLVGVNGESLNEKVASLLGVLEFEDLLGQLGLLQSLGDVKLLAIKFLLVHLFNSLSGGIGVLKAHESE